MILVSRSKARSDDSDPFSIGISRILGSTSVCLEARERERESMRKHDRLLYVLDMSPGPSSSHKFRVNVVNVVNVVVDSPIFQRPQRRFTIPHAEIFLPRDPAREIASRCLCSKIPLRDVHHGADAKQTSILRTTERIGDEVGGGGSGGGGSKSRLKENGWTEKSQWEAASGCRSGIPLPLSVKFVKNAR